MVIAPARMSLRSCVRPRILGLVVPLVWCLAASPAAGQTPSAAPETDPAAGQPRSATASVQTPSGTAEQTQTPTTAPAQPAGGQTTSGETPTPFNIAPPARPSRPYRSVFGMPASNMVPLLTFEASAGAGFNGNPVAAESSGVGGPGGAGTGAATGSANLMYSLHRRGFGIDAGNAAYGDYYPQQADNKFMPRDIGSVTVYFMPTRSTRVDVSETFKNLPEFAASELHEAAFGDIIPPNQPIGVTVNRYTRYGTTVDVSQRLSHRARADMSAGYGHGMLPSSNWTVLTFSGDLNYLIAKGIVVYGGYEYGGQTFYVPGAKSVKENHPRMNGGIDFTRALSFSRRTTLSFSAGTAGVHDRVANTTVYHLVGSAELQREFGRTWNAAAVYGRNVRYSEALFEPIFSDSLAVVLSGSFSRRLDVKSVFTAARGHIGATTGSNADSYYGVVQFSYGISRSLALGADYLYSHLTSTPTAIPVSDLTDLSQQSVRVYVKLWVPLMSTARRP